MSRAAVVIAVIIALAACKRDDASDRGREPAAPVPPPVVAPAGPCPDAAAALAKVATNDAGDAGTVKLLFAAVEPAIESRCTADAWSADAIRCYAAVRIVADLVGCKQVLTPAQDEALNQAMVAAMKSVANVVN